MYAMQILAHMQVPKWLDYTFLEDISVRIFLFFINFLLPYCSCFVYTMLHSLHSVDWSYLTHDVNMTGSLAVFSRDKMLLFFFHRNKLYCPIEVHAKKRRTKSGVEEGKKSLLTME